LAVAHAVALFERKEVDRIILSRPAVEAGERLGFLPGDMREKVDPYLRPIYDALFDLMDARIVERAMQSGEIEIAPLAFMRGRTLSNAVVILDEAQNTTSMQMKMFLTRLGENGRMIVTGDPSQTDLPSGQTSGLSEAIRLLANVEGVGHVAFTKDDVVRHELVARIVEAYDNATNVLSFPPAAGAAEQFSAVQSLGDIAIAYETSAREAAEEHKPLDHHLAHLAVHGFLHLLGHDHDTESAATTMEQLERVILARLGVPDPYLTHEPDAPHALHAVRS